TDTIVATRITLVEGTKEFPLRVNQTIAKLKQEVPERIRASAKEIEETLAKSQKDAIGDSAPNGNRQESDLVSVTWLPESKRLLITFRHIITNGLYSRGDGTKATDEEGHRSRDFGPPSQRYGTTFGVEVRVPYLISNNGEIHPEPV